MSIIIQNVFAADIEERSKGIFHGTYQRLFTTFDGRKSYILDSRAEGTEFGERSGVNGLTTIESESTQSGVQTLWSSLNTDTSLNEKITKKGYACYFLAYLLIQ